MVAAAKTAGLHVRAGVQCALGCVYEGRGGAGAGHEDVDDVSRSGADAVVVSDTTGMGSPLSVKRLLDYVCSPPSRRCR